MRDILDIRKKNIMLVLPVQSTISFRISSLNLISQQKWVKVWQNFPKYWSLWVLIRVLFSPSRQLKLIGLILPTWHLKYPRVVTQISEVEVIHKTPFRWPYLGAPRLPNLTRHWAPLTGNRSLASVHLIYCSKHNKKTVTGSHRSNPASTHPGGTWLWSQMDTW